MGQVKSEKLIVNGRPFTRVVRVNNDGLFRITLPSELAEFHIREAGNKFPGRTNNAQAWLAHAKRDGSVEVVATTLDWAEKLFNTCKGQYVESKTTTRKVIAVHTKMCGEIYRGPELERDEDGQVEDWQEYREGVRLDRADISFAEGAGLMLRVTVMEETRIERVGGAVTYLYESLPSSLPRSFNKQNRCGDDWGLSYNYDPVKDDGKGETQVIPWTAEAEAFFLKLCTALEELMLGLDKMLTDKKTLLQSIKTGKLMLTGPK